MQNRKRNVIMGVESSCDETAIALVDDQCQILAHQMFSQIDIHRAWGGVVPELASRDHCVKLLPLWQKALEEAGCAHQDIDAVAYTCGPGLAGALMMGATFAVTLARLLGKPIYPIHHLEGHIVSAMPVQQTFPALIVLVSGGHTMIIAAKTLGRYQILGETVDDAVGEAFDKTAKLMGLPYPGGPHLEQIAKQGNAKAFDLPRPMYHDATFNMSFSGLKTAVLHAWQSCPQRDQDRCDLAASFQQAVADVLTKKLRAAIRATGIHTCYICGGVAANKHIAQQLHEMVNAEHGQWFAPPSHMCTDNGMMIALAGCLHHQMGYKTLETSTILMKPRYDLKEYTSTWCQVASDADKRIKS